MGDSYLGAFGGLKIVESQFVPEGAAYMMPDGAMAVPIGMSGKLAEINRDVDTVDLGADIFRDPVVKGAAYTASTTDGKTLSVEMLDELSDRIQKIYDEKFTKVLYGEKVDDAKQSDKATMESDPMWGSF